jgi:regulator of RNase E activity RraA
MAKRKVGALITDGVMRDMEGVLATGLAVWCAGAAAPASVAGLTFINWQEPIACGGVAVFPGDTIVADGDGAVVIPQAMLTEIVELAAEQETQESWIMGEIEKGVPLPGLYPPNEETKARYAAWRKSKGAG